MPAVYQNSLKQKRVTSDEDEPRLTKTVTGKPPDPIKTELKPGDLKDAVIAFGKFNPPHVGHEKIVNEVKRLAGTTGDALVYLSKAPGVLHYEEKLRYCQEAFGPVIRDTEHATLWQILEDIQRQYRKITVVVGEDRFAEFNDRLPTYFPNVTVHAVERPVDAASSTAMRKYVAEGDYGAFLWALPDPLVESADKLFEEIKLALTAKDLVSLYSRLIPKQNEGPQIPKASDRIRRLQIQKRIIDGER